MSGDVYLYPFEMAGAVLPPDGGLHVVLAEGWVLSFACKSCGKGIEEGELVMAAKFASGRINCWHWDRHGIPESLNGHLRRRLIAEAAALCR